ncbi:hypothetical protein [Rhodococcus sp. NPDC058514]|uniref:hypothetical protein n=1 Tax=unclassified Rhodococcus (in: high G+C Gram-positive bacteria) TaxID=192944 RepID=UPI0036658A3D
MTVLLAAVGVVAGLVAATAWHVAAPSGVQASLGPVSASYAPSRPGWWPSLLVLPAVGAGLGLVIGALVIGKRWRLRRAPGSSLVPLAVLLVALAVVSGGAFAAAWSVWPPPDTYAVAREFQELDDRLSAPGASEEHCRRPNVVCVMVQGTADSELHPGTLVEPPFRVPIGNPWLTFPLLSMVGAASAGFVVGRAGGRLVRPSASATT